MNRRIVSLMSLLSVPVALLIGALPLWAQSSTNGISEPKPGDILSGIVLIEGTAGNPDFLRFELAFFQESRPEADWIVFAQGDQPVTDGTLSVWDTTIGGEDNPVFPDGQYQLRLRVVRTDYNYGEYYVPDLEISNLSPTPTITPTVQLEAITPTLLPGTALAATLQSGAEILPSLTPFPTPSPLATPESGLIDLDNGTEEGENKGLLDQLSGIDTGQFGTAFGLGVRIVAYAFLCLGAYIVLRKVLRWLWRVLLRNWHERR